MNNHNPAPIFFYYPLSANPNSIPEVEGQYVTRRSGQYIWTVKTFGLLRSLGYACNLTDTIPDAGIIISHRDFLPASIRPNANQLLVCVVADDIRHPYAQLHILQNRRDPVLRRASVMWKSAYIPHWTETGLTPRDPARGDQLTNVAYLGLEIRLEPQLRGAAFRALMAQHGYQFQIVDPQNWNDYSQIDVVLAVRSFAALPYYRNPATKLFNSWVAGVPALLGHESAYQSERRSELDYIEVQSVEQILDALDRLKNDPAWRKAIQQNGLQRRQDVTPENIAKHWTDMFEQIARPALAHWQNLPAWRRQTFFAVRTFAYVWYRITDFVVRAVSTVRKQLASRLV